MRGCLLLLCLASLWGDSSSEECVRELQEDTDFPGSDVLQILSPDVHHCQMACTQHHSCRFFTFVRPDWTGDNRQFYCYLKHTPDGKPLKVNSINGATAGYALKNCEGSQQVCLSEVYKDVDFAGADYKSLFTDSYENCQKTCTKDPYCTFFTYVTADYPEIEFRHKCYLKHRRTLPNPPAVISNQNAASGFSKAICSTTSTECTAVLHRDTDYPGNDFETVPAPSPEYCQVLCTAHPRCTFFTYNRVRKVCFLKHNTEKRHTKAESEAISGFPNRLCGPPSGCMEKRFEDTDFPGYDRKSLKLGTVQECEDACTADPSCHFYTYAYSTFHDPAYRQYCHLKQVITIPLVPSIKKVKGAISGFGQSDCHTDSIVG
ncbi:hypothetical protein AGOR_G00038400 [Albula goreensis]|uniref:Apple domain-containing protein n=1 Tax=Albula goreensis TaxID=1534307 RepID=A0A8T3E2G9_9TELE|nr:hypothetical protein AGOR_G00038400 [Albula goreensis]